MKRFTALLFVVLSVLMTRAQSDVDSLPPWEPGFLDIHNISTGRGSCQLIVFPDGTTMMIDAGDFNREKFLHTHPKLQCQPLFPDSTTTAAKAIASYVNSLGLPVTGLDYFLLTHMHSDHLGEIYGSQPVQPEGHYTLTGITEVNEYLPIRHLVDRAYPHYDTPVELDRIKSNGKRANESVSNYIKFVNYRSNIHEMTVECFNTGSQTQFVPKYNPARYPMFSITNIKGNNMLWTGNGNDTHQLFAIEDMFDSSGHYSENMLSCALLVEYGPFRYYTGGDNTGSEHRTYGSIHDIETPMARIIGRVSAMTLNHHGNKNATNATFLSTLDPHVVIIPAWSGDHPGKKVARRLIDKSIGSRRRDIYATSFDPERTFEIGSWFKRHVIAANSHIVIRVTDDGTRYRVYGIDAADPTMRVTYKSPCYITE